MPKDTGVGARIQIDDSGGTLRDISNDILSFSFRTPRGIQDVTGLDKAGMERLLLIADGHVEVRMAMNPTVNRQHDVFKTVPSTSVVRTVTIDPVGTTVGDPRLSMEMLFSDYSVDRAQSGEVTCNAVGDLADGTAPTWTTVP